MKQTHIPVLLPEVIALLDPKQGESLFDGTAGYGGHTAAILDKIGDRGRVILVDRDSNAIQSLQERFGDRVELIRATYLEAAGRLAREGTEVDLILLDLGVSSPQLDNAGRGFSFKADGPLDMRMDQSQSLTAETVVNTYSERDLTDLIYRFGEERKARQIAREIVAKRPIATTGRLAEIVRRVVRSSGDIDPATRTFQALRIEVNAELTFLEQALPVLLSILSPGGRLAVISFHSLEDRIVKEFFNRESRDCICPPKQPVCTCNHTASVRKLSTRAVQATNNESNPRARSAKLRAAAKLNKNQKEV